MRARKFQFPWRFQSPKTWVDLWCWYCRFFYSLNVKKKYSTLALLGIAIALTVYYLAWVRFFVDGGSVELLSAPLFGIPGPLALAPVALLIVSSYLMDSWLMFSASVSFGALHVWASSVTG